LFNSKSFCFWDNCILFYLFSLKWADVLFLYPNWKIDSLGLSVLLCVWFWFILWLSVIQKHSDTPDLHIGGWCWQELILSMLSRSMFKNSSWRSLDWRSLLVFTIFYWNDLTAYSILRQNWLFLEFVFVFETIALSM